jgi:hypothetical protein
MPRPVYILCSQSNAVDKSTNLISFFNLVEELRIAKIPEGTTPPATRPFTMRVVSVWMNTDDDMPSQLFETEFAVKFPKMEELPEELVFGRSNFSFTTLFNRLISPDLAIETFTGPGLMWVECRIRRAGETEWLARQEYPILLIETGTTSSENGKAE